MVESAASGDDTCLVVAKDTEGKDQEAAPVGSVNTGGAVGSPGRANRGQAGKLETLKMEAAFTTERHYTVQQVTGRMGAEYMDESETGLRRVGGSM